MRQGAVSDRTEQSIAFHGSAFLTERASSKHVDVNVLLSLSLSSFERKDETSGGAHTTAAAVAAALHSMMQADGSWQARLHRLCAIVVTIVLIAISF